MQIFVLKTDNKNGIFIVWLFAGESVVLFFKKKLNKIWSPLYARQSVYDGRMLRNHCGRFLLHSAESGLGAQALLIIFSNNSIFFSANVSHSPKNV